MDDRNLNPQQYDAHATGPTCDLPDGAQRTAEPQSAATPEKRPEQGNSAESSTDSSSSTAERLKSVASDVYQQASRGVKDSTTQATERLREQGSNWIGVQKDRLVEELSDVSHAMQEATETLQRHKDYNVAACTQFVADKAEQASNYLRAGDPSRLRGDIERFARRRPEVFFGGLFLIGLAASRFLTARPVPSGDFETSEMEDDEQFQHYDWSAS